jgi:hypothetical protein
MSGRRCPRSINKAAVDVTSKSETWSTGQARAGTAQGVPASWVCGSCEGFGKQSHHALFH